MIGGNSDRSANGTLRLLSYGKPLTGSIHAARISIWFPNHPIQNRMLLRCMPRRQRKCPLLLKADTMGLAVARLNRHNRHKSGTYPPRSSIPDDLAGHARQAERAFQGGAVPRPGRSGRFIGTHQKVHERLLRVVGGAHRVVGQIVLV